MKTISVDLNNLTDDELEAYLVLKRAVNRQFRIDELDSVPDDDGIPDELPDAPEYTQQ